LILCAKEHAKAIDRAVFPGLQGGPLMHVIAAKAVALREARSPAFARYQRQIVANAAHLADALTRRGQRIVSGGTDNHLLLVDVAAAGHTGRLAEAALERAGITVNKNTIPYDAHPPMVASGIRLGTAAVTTRGMRQPEMERVAEAIAGVLAAPESEQALAAIRGAVRELCREFPLFAA